MFIPDNGFPSRAFAYGGALGLVSSLISPYRAYTVNNSNFVSTYSLRTFAFLGIILVWCTYPILVTVDVYNSTKSYIIAMSGQVNMWIALAGSAIGCFIASMYVHRKFCVHDMVFASITVNVLVFREELHIRQELSSTTIQEQLWPLVLWLDYSLLWLKPSSRE